MTVSHLRFGPRPDPVDLSRRPGAVRGLPPVGTAVADRRARACGARRDGPAEQSVPRRSAVGAAAATPPAAHIVEKQLRVFAIDASAVAAGAGVGKRVNTVLQACFFALSGVLPREAAIAAIKRAAKKTYGTKGDDIVQANFAAIDAALAGMHDVPIGAAGRPRARRGLTGRAQADLGQRIRVRQARDDSDDRRATATGCRSRPCRSDGTFPVGTSKYEKRSIAAEIPVWNAVTLHPVQQVHVRVPARGHSRQGDRAVAIWSARPATFKAIDYRGSEFEGMKYSIQVAPEDCTGCDLCVQVCPAKDKATGVKALVMSPQPPLLDQERVNFAFFLSLPEIGSHPGEGQLGQGLAVPAAALRVLRRLRRLRRDAVPEAGDAVVRRPDGGGERDRVLVDLRRQPADDAVDLQRRRPGTGVGELAVRGQRRVRLRHAPDDRPAGRARADAGARAGAARSARDWPRRSSAPISATSRASTSSGKRVELLKDVARHAPVRPGRPSCSTSPTTS